MEEEEVKEEEEREASPQGSVRPGSLRSFALAPAKDSSTSGSLQGRPPRRGRERGQVRGAYR